MQAPDSPITFVIPGTRRDIFSRGGGVASRPHLPMGLEGDLRVSVEVGTRRAGGETHRVTAQPGQDVVVMQIENGPSLVLHPTTARDLLMAQSVKQRGISRGSGVATELEVGPQEVEVSPRLQWQGLENASVVSPGATRGLIGDVVLKVIDVIGLKGRAQEMVADELARRIDGRVHEAVYALRPEALTPLKGQPPLETLPPAPAGSASLVFVHGTFSTTSESGFANLWTHHPKMVASLFRHYGDRVYALDHATLGSTPIENALTLAQACPADTVLHLVTHSRGGLVAEVLSRAADLQTLDAAGEELFSAEHLWPQRDLLRKLIELLHERRIRVDRTVRVACPARGTLLASQRLDAYVSVLRWALTLAGLPVLPELVDFLGGVARERTDPTTLPGLAVMTPDSPLVKWLHAAEQEVHGELRVVAGDLQGDSVRSWAKTLMADALFWTDNDLVVQTRSMYGGAPRAEGASFVLDRSGASSHFNYFTNERTAAAIINALIEVSPTGWRVIGPMSYAGTTSDGLRGARRGTGDGRPMAEKPAVIVLPGILGSHLRVNGKRIWLSWRLLNGFAQLDYPDGNRTVVADGPIGSTYDGLLDYLAESHEVIPFSYDWRQPIENEARRLGTEVEAALVAREQSGQPVRLLAHSMGGLLARALQIECGPIWDRMMERQGARLLMLGTPNAGSWAPMQVLSGDDSFGNTLTGVGAPFQDHAARASMARFPGFLQLQAGLLDSSLPLNTRAGWQQLAENDLNQVKACSWWHQDRRQLEGFLWGVPDDAVLAQAVRFWEKLRKQRDNDLPLWQNKLALVVGSAAFTTDGYETGADGLEYLDAPDSGDGRVSYDSAMLPGVRTWKLDCDHGRLPAAKGAFKAFRELLEKGETTLLPSFQGTGITRGDGAATPPAPIRRSRPSRQRGTSQPRSSDDDLYALSADASSSEIAPRQETLSIIVQNGNLSFVRQALMLGHYTSSTLTGPEAVVDGLIGGTMGEALAMGCYPDRPGSHQVFINTGIGRVNPLQPPKPESVIVVGLGEEGKLSAANLSYSVQMAVVAVAQRHMERLEGGERQFELASTLLGSGGSGIDAGQAAQLIAQGVRDANKLLRKQERWPWVGTLHLVELYLDRASLALNALKVLAEAQPDDFEITPTVRAGQGWERRPLDWGYRGAGYDFISALTDNEAGTDSSSSVIRYTMDTHRARTEMHAQSSQRHLVEQLVANASNADCSDDQICRSLFKLLVPVELEPALGGTSAMVLELDQGTAPIPWEMLDYEGGSQPDPNHVPWAIRTKLLRKLQLAEFRQRPRDASRSSQALVIGEPLCDNPDLPRLPGARKEARAVRDKLQEVLGADRVMTLISPEANEGPGPDAVKVINTLMDRDWRIVHISGHGLLPEQGDPRGVVLSNGLYLGPREIHNMRVVPELVFVNCCHLAASAPERLMAKPYNRAKFAASLAEQLIHNGVRCVVAAGWAVADDAAETFAQQFYAALLSGQRFIDAVAIARKAAWRRSPDINTWAAYQCYGDPDWVFQAEGTDAQNPQPQNANQYAAVVSPSSLTLALESLTIKATTVQVPNTAEKNKENDLGKELRQQLQDLETSFESKWGSQGEVARCFGVAWDAAKDSDKAIAWYERALKAEDGGASLKSYEQLANLRVRQAWRQVDGAGRQLDEAGGAIPGQEITANAAEQFQLKLQQARDEIQRGLEALQQLITIGGGTMERLSLCGSAQKRLAMLERKAGDKAAEDKALQAMSDWYGRAEEVGNEGASPNVFYPALNKMAAECVLHAGDTAWPGFNASHLVSLRQTLEQKRLNDPDFWSEIGVAELSLYEALAKRSLTTRLPAIRDEYAHLHQRANDPRQWGSVCDQLDFVLPRYIERVAQTDLAEVEAAEALLAEVKGYAG